MLVTLTIPKADEWLNSNDRRHHMARWRIGRTWREAAKVYAIKAKLPHLQKARITATIHRARSNRSDALNFAPTIKPIIDGLIDYGLLPDDDDKHLLVDVRGGVAGTPRVELVIEDLL
ncbi:hypothetical protein [Psychromicrobium lacuslunae]|uniref:Uncharacterized protein n=1 Tax=Psychromicrobium lacuslunae TaxID=1618207 RepID=A0A0D4C129_9MICC|nr:hypothetical protein [Psychromicrobium lacuslunae]AJT42397.1 hypothetical protein UM93_14470 [Psychromicrobium lacuslunae]